MKNQIKKASSHDHRVLETLSQFDVKAMKATAAIDLDALDEKSSTKKEAVVVEVAPIDAPASVSPIVDALKETATRSKQEKAEKLDEKLSMKNQIKKVRDINIIFSLTYYMHLAIIILVVFPLLNQLPFSFSFFVITTAVPSLRLLHMITVVWLVLPPNLLPVVSTNPPGSHLPSLRNTVD